MQAAIAQKQGEVLSTMSQLAQQEQERADIAMEFLTLSVHMTWLS